MEHETKKNKMLDEKNCIQWIDGIKFNVINDS